MNAGAARAAVNEAALARDRVALVAAAAAMPARQEFAYERHRGRAYAFALAGSHEAATAELNLAAAADPPSAARLAVDIAHLHVLLGDPSRALTALAVAARSELWLDPHARDVLVAAVHEAPWEWRRAARVALATRNPAAALAAAGAAFDSLGDQGTFRVAIAGGALATAIVALFALPGLLFDSPREFGSVTGPSAAGEPRVVVVPDRPEPAADRPAAPAADPPDAPAPAPVAVPTLVSADAPPPTRSAAQTQRPTPRASRPAPPRTRNPAPPPAPAPAPAPSPAPEPAPAPAALTAAPAPAPATPAPPASAPAVKKNGKPEKPKKAAPQPEPAPPAPSAAPAPAPAPAGAAPPEHAKTPGPPPEPPGQAKDKDNQNNK